jgi:hypothetical protein
MSPVLLYPLVRRVRVPVGNAGGSSELLLVVSSFLLVLPPLFLGEEACTFLLDEEICSLLFGDAFSLLLGEVFSLLLEGATCALLLEVACLLLLEAISRIGGSSFPSAVPYCQEARFKSSIVVEGLSDRKSITSELSSLAPPLSTS